MLPVGELRFSIPWAIFEQDLNFWLVMPVAIVGNAIPVLVLYFGLPYITNFLRGMHPLIDKFVAWIFSHTYRRHTKKFDTYGSLALMLFIAIPLPFTGGWTGALAAYLFNIKPKYAVPNLMIGLVISAIIVTTFSLATNWIFFV
ncbi:MAG: small multi-drug export protein [Patescibacteria group bacterium]|nr:small multi-drug export protein [Patescibacteria group bacterium]